MNRKPLYQPWNEEHFMADERVQVMSKYAVWIYRTLLGRAFFCSTRPYLPDDDNLLWSLAGCESKDQWLKYRPEVVPMFKPTTRRGQKLLCQKRVLRDWNALRDLRKAKSESGVKSGIARKRKKTNELQVNERSTNVERTSNENEQDKISKDKLKRSEGKEENPLPPFGQEGESEMSLKKDITSTCLTVLGIKPSITMDQSSALSALERAFPEKVADDFQAWAEEQQGQKIAYPIQDYLRVGAGRLSGIIMTAPSQDLQELLDRIGMVAGNTVTFNKQQLVSLQRLVEQYGQPNVFMGFISFYNTLDDFSVKFAARDFVEKGTQIVRNRVAACKKQEEHQTISDRLTAKGQVEVKNLQEEYAKKQREEEEAASDAPKL